MAFFPDCGIGGCKHGLALATLLSSLGSIGQYQPYEDFSMFVAMNRFRIKIGNEADFEAVWKNRDSSLAEMKGFESFHLLRGATNEEEGFTLYASHTIWASKEDFTAWTQSEQFRAAHKNAGNNKPLYIGHPQFEGFTSVLGA